MKLGLVFALFSSISLCCEINFNGSTLIEDVDSFSGQIEKVMGHKVCEDFTGITSGEELTKQIDVLVQNQTNEVWKIKNRHDMGGALNECSPNKESRALVLSFAGTGAFNPRAHSLMATLIKCDQVQGLPEWMKKHLYSKVLASLEKKKSSYTKWSGIERGILNKMISEPGLNQKAKNYDFAIFPSEESELIAAPEKISFSKLRDIASEVRDSKAGRPVGIGSALSCASNYFSKAKALGISPKLIVLSHSSGGRSAVKFLERLKAYVPHQKANLVMTIDPVKEAHHAIEEVASQYAGKARDKVLEYIPFVNSDENDGPVNVWTRKQPESLYKTSNSDRWINFYQNVDRHGLGASPKFGIHGSPVANADENQFIKGLTSKGHGDICFDEDVLKKMSAELINL